MKKNVMMRLASFLLIAVLISTSAISGTYAKYVTAKEGSDEARVAKWGVTITANGETFAKDYATDDAVFTEAKSVISTDKVVAPGTKGDMASVELTGTPEVAVRVSYEADIELNGWELSDNSPYCPLVFKINNASYLADPMAGLANYRCANIEELIQKMEAAIAAYSKDYPAGTDLSTVGADALGITWEWAFSNGDSYDAKDTDLGNKAANGEAATVSITVKTTVTQID